MRIPLLMYLAACGGQTGDPPRPAGPTAIEVRDGNKLVAKIVPGQPCRATVDGVQLDVAGPPLAAKVGNDAWKGDDGANGTMLFENDVYVARLFGGSLFDSQGLAIARIAIAGDTASVGDAASRPVRTLARTAAGITSGKLAVTGTDDLAVAAILTAKEARPEVRALAACRQLLASVSEANDLNPYSRAPREAIKKARPEGTSLP